MTAADVAVRLMILAVSDN